MQGLVYGSDWFKVYDIIEALHAAMVRNDQKDGSNDARKFGEELNAYFLEEGIGWQLVDGQVVTRGTETFEATVTSANKALEASNRPTAAGHIHEALMDLSRRPAADLSGAVYHAMGALEAVARDLTGEQTPRSTNGGLPERSPGCYCAGQPDGLV